MGRATDAVLYVLKGQNEDPANKFMHIAVSLISAWSDLLGEFAGRSSLRKTVLFFLTHT